MASDKARPGCLASLLAFCSAALPIAHRVVGRSVNTDVEKDGRHAQWARSGWGAWVGGEIGIDQFCVCDGHLGGAARVRA